MRNLVNLRDLVSVSVLAALCVAMAFVPPAHKIASGASTMRARVLSVDNSQITLTGLVEYGTQHLKVEMLEGPEKGSSFNAENELRGQLDFDKKFVEGNTILIDWPSQGATPGVTTLVARDHYRLGWAIVLFGIFAIALILFGGATGAKALFSFVFGCVAVWKLIIPLCLNGWNASITIFIVVCLLSMVIMYLVAGFTRKAAAALTGTLLGVGVSLASAYIISKLMHVDGAAMPFVQALMYTGYPDLDLYDIFCGTVILASSGAVMDLAMDVSAGIEEVLRRNPALSRRELFVSGIRLGRAVVGTMTTTLLLAYSGGYLTLLMAFAAHGTSPVDFLNSTIVSAELVKTLVGSFGLVLVAPFTAATGAILIGGKRNFDVEG